MSLVEFPPKPREIPKDVDAIFRDTSDEEVIAFKARMRERHHLLQACAALAGHLVNYKESMTGRREEGNPYRQGSVIHTIAELQETTARNAIGLYLSAREAIDMPGASWPEHGPLVGQLRMGEWLHLEEYRDCILSHGDKNGE